MIEPQPLNESTLAREALKRLSDPGNVLARVVQVLELVAHNTVGLGEVLQDYAHQSVGQLKLVIHSALQVTQGASRPDDQQVLQNIHFTFKAAKAVLEMTPAAMERNKAASIGEKEKLTCADIVEVTHAFLHSPDVVWLLASEDSGTVMAALVPVAEGSVMTSEGDRSLAASH